MRAIEATLLLFDLVAFLLLAWPGSRRGRSPLYAGLAAVLALAGHLAVEGWRWQMVPAYGLTFILLAATLVLGRTPPPATRGPGRRFAGAVGLGLAALALVVAAIVPVAVPSFRLADPTGPYAIGTQTYHWIDPTRADWSDAGRRRELMVQVWYPAEVVRGARRDTYVQRDMDFSTLTKGMGLPPFFFDHLKRVPTHAYVAAPVARAGGRFPVVLFSPGAQGFRQHNMFQVEDLVSQGYIVAGIDHPGSATHVSFPDGRGAEFDARRIDIPRFFRDPEWANGIYNYLGRDASFVIDQLIATDRSDPKGVLTGRLATDRMGFLGISMGGLVGAEACRTDPRLHACDLQDVFVPQDVLRDGLQPPTMWFTRDAASMRAEGWPKWEVDHHQDTMRQAFEGVRTDAYLVKLPGMFHVNYTDFPYVIAGPVAQRIGMTGAIDWRHGHRVINAYTLAFFDRYLKGEREPLLDGPSARFPEVSIETRRHGPAAATPAAPATR